MTPFTFSIGNRSFSHNVFIINNLSHDVILGKDFLELHKSKIDLENHNLHLQDNFPSPNYLALGVDHLLQDPPCCSIHALQSYILPPNTETIICGKLNSALPQGSVGIVDPRSELSNRYSICGAAELVTIPPSGTVPIRLLNPTNQAIRIYRRTQLGTFSPTGNDVLAINISGPCNSEVATNSEVPLLGDPHITFDLSQTSLSLSEQEQLRNLLA